MLKLGKSFNERIDSWAIGIIFYHFLMDQYPFGGRSLYGTIERIKKQEIDFNEPQWANFSVEALDLLDQLLQKKPTMRLTPEQILLHPFI